MRRTRLLLVFSLLFALILALAACGRDEALSDEQYFRNMDEIDKETDRRFEEEVFNSEDPTVGEGVEPFVKLARDVADQADELKPPDDVKAAHEEIVASVRDFADKLDAAGKDADQEAALSGLFEGDVSGVAAAETRLNAAFCALQAIADEKNIDADVGCEEGSGEEQLDPATLEPVETTAVLIEGFAFDPPHIQVSVGDTVTWTQGTDGEPHTATADDETFASDVLQEGDTFDFTFEEPGEFPYFCEIHPEMLGQVTVVE